MSKTVGVRFGGLFILALGIAIGYIASRSGITDAESAVAQIGEGAKSNDSKEGHSRSIISPQFDETSN